MRKIILLVVVLALIGGCSGQKTRVYPVEPDEDQVDISLSDMKGFQLRLDRAPQRLVLLGELGADIIEELGVSERVEGTLSNLSPRGYKGLKKYTYEEILGGLVDTDLYIAGPELSEAMREEFYKKNLPLIILDIEEQGDIYRAIEVLGRALGKNLAAREEVRYLEKSWEELSLKEDYKGTIYIEKDGKSLGQRSLLGQLLFKLGYDSMEKLAEEKALSSEELRSLNPDYVLIVGEKGSLDLDRFSETSAASKNRIYFWQDERLRGSSFIDEMKDLLKILK